MDITTKGDLVIAALRKIAVASSASATDVDPASAEDGINDLEMMMAEWLGGTDSPGIDVGYVFAATGAPVDPGDPHGLANNALNAVITNLACRLTPDYEITPNSKLVATARSGKEGLVKLSALSRARTARRKPGYPNRMPVGSGNRFATNNGWNYFHREDTDNADSATSTDEGNG